MQYRTLGHTGKKVSIVGVGGFHIGVSYVSEEESQRIIRTAIDDGINFMDNSWSYNGGQSEIRMGKALRDGYRQKVFLMTKLDGRDAKSATTQLDESLKHHPRPAMNGPPRIRFAPDRAYDGFPSIIQTRSFEQTTRRVGRHLG